MLKKENPPPPFFLSDRVSLCFLTPESQQCDQDSRLGQLGSQEDHTGTARNLHEQLKCPLEDEERNKV